MKHGVFRGRFAHERLKVQMPEGELAYRLLSLPVYLAEKLPDSQIASV
jgi:hypothetical protein